MSAGPLRPGPAGLTAASALGAGLTAAGRVLTAGP